MRDSIKEHYETFSGSDTLAFALFPEAKPITLGELTTISYSIYREKKPVVTLNRINVAGYTRGPRFIAGSLVFNILNKSFVNDVIEKIDYLKDYGRIKADELPLFDILIIGANEYGYTNKMKIYGCEIGDESQVVDVNQIITNNKFTFAARDIDTFGYEDTKANYTGTQNIMFDSRPSVEIEQAFETENYIDTSNISDFIEEKEDEKPKKEITPEDGKLIEGYVADWWQAHNDFENELISKRKSEIRKSDAHHGAQMIRAKYHFVGEKDGVTRAEFAPIEILKNNVIIYGDRKLNQVAETANKGDRFYISYNSGNVSYITKSKDTNASVLYIQNGQFKVV